MNIKYPFDPSIKHHFFIAGGLAVWIFVFLYFTEPLDVHEFTDSEQLIYLPLYGLLGAFLYIMMLPFQKWLYKKNSLKWNLTQEILFLIVFICISIVILRLFYLHVVMDWHPNAYSLWYYIRAIIFPALLTILPIILIGRFSFGKFKEKKLEAKKIEIKGEGQYESLRLLITDLISIQSSDNYVEVFFLDGSHLKKTLIRNKLSVIAETFPELLRTHRGFIINPYHFQSWKTENGKHFLRLSQSVEVPISKTYLKAVKLQFNSATS